MAEHYGAVAVYARNRHITMLVSPELAPFWKGEQGRDHALSLKHVEPGLSMWPIACMLAQRAGAAQDRSSMPSCFLHSSPRAADERMRAPTNSEVSSQRALRSGLPSSLIVYDLKDP
ncbi:hypothetical protein DRO21_07270 [archaeon]|nr:MAG: hypothetical protein DRO21_07270 [archaeon]